MFEFLISVGKLFVKPNENQNKPNWFSSWNDYLFDQQVRDMQFITNLENLGNVDLKYPCDERSKKIEENLKKTDCNIDWEYLSGKK
jgi:hypothetical protein